MREGSNLLHDCSKTYKGVEKFMVEVLLEFMLGPIRGIGDFYFEYQMIFNPIVILAALSRMWLTRKNNQQTETG